MEVRRDFPGQADQPQVLYNRRIHARTFEQNQLFFRGWQLIGEDQHIKGDVALYAVVVQEIHQLRQVVRREIRRAHPRIEGGHAEVNGVGAVGHGGFRAFPIACGGKKFGLHRLSGSRRNKEKVIIGKKTRPPYSS